MSTVPLVDGAPDITLTVLCCVLLASTTPLHDFGSLIFSDDDLHLEQEVIFRALARGRFKNTTSTPRLRHSSSSKIGRCNSSQPVGWLDIDPVDDANVYKIAQPIQGWTNESGLRFATRAVESSLAADSNVNRVSALTLTESGTNVAIINKLSLGPAWAAQQAEKIRRIYWDR